MKQIIRVEHTDGIGLFSSRGGRPCAADILPDVSARHNLFNTPWEDELDMELDDFCAYKSIEHIQEWIKAHEFEILFKNNYSVYLLEVSNFKEGKDNILFKKRDIISKKDISSLFK